MSNPQLDTMSPLQAIRHERVKQDAKWGEQDHSDPEWLVILTEEVGEAAEATCESHFDNPQAQQYDDLLDYELVQIAAVAVAWLESRRRQRREADGE